jgi:hypothetical protein
METRKQATLRPAADPKLAAIWSFLRVEIGEPRCR